MATKKKVTKSATKTAEKAKTPAPKKTGNSGTSARTKAKAAAAKTARPAPSPAPKAAKAKASGPEPVKTKATSPAAKPRTRPAAKAAARTVVKPTKATSASKAPAVAVKVTPSVTAKKNAETSAKTTADTALEGKPVDTKAKPAPAAAAAPANKPKSPRTTLDDLALDVEEKDQLLEEEKRDLAKALREDDDEPLETAFVPTDTSERIILVVDEDGQRRTETVSIVQQILPNAVIELADDPEEALEVMEEAEFDTYVVNFLMPGFSASPFVKAVTNHPDRPLLIGFAADKISDALDQRKGLKIIPLKRLFDLDPQPDAAKDKAAED